MTTSEEPCAVCGIPPSDQLEPAAYEAIWDGATVRAIYELARDWGLDINAIVDDHRKSHHHGDAYLRMTREDWERRAIDIEGFPRLVSNARVLGGSPVIEGTRVETAFIFHVAQELEPKEILRLYPYVDEEGLYQALEFERDPLAA